MSRCWDVLGVGVVAVDDLYFVDQHPQPDTKQRIAGKRRQGGGNAATAMVAAARLGTIAAFCAILGDDDLSGYTLAELEREGVDCSPIVRRAWRREAPGSARGSGGGSAGHVASAHPPPVAAAALPAMRS